MNYTADWLLTWLVHATIACSFALLVARALRDPSARDRVWKAALVLPLVTSILAVALPISRRPLDVEAVTRQATHLAPTSARVSVQSSGAAAVSSVRVRDTLAQTLRYALLAAILFPAFFAGVRMTRRRCQWRTALRGRRFVDARDLGLDTPALSVRGRPVRLSVSPHVETASAVRDHEICVSEALTTLGVVERNAVIAHEVAHLERRDVAWSAFADYLASVLAAQPLVCAVARRLRRDAEFICDDAAVNRTGDAHAYVRTLILFAEMFDTSDAPTAVAYGGSPIVQRAEHVLQRRAAGRAVGAAAALAAVTILVGLLALPPLRIADSSRTMHANVVTRTTATAGHGKAVTLKVTVR